MMTARTSNTRWILAAVTVAIVMPVLTGCGGGNTTLPKEEAPSRSTLQKLVEQARQKRSLPSLAVAVVRAEGEPVVAAAGIRHLGENYRVTADDRYSIGSCGKAMTGTLIALLVAEGKLSYDATLASLFPEFSGLHSSYRAVTLAQLLECRAGLQPFTSGDEFAALPPIHGAPVQQRAAFARYLLESEPDVAPGTFQYSNASYILAAVIAERVTGKPWETLMEERVYGPLRMTVQLGPPAMTERATQPWGHQWTNNQWSPVAPEDAGYIPAAAPSGDQNLTLRDWSRFVQVHLRALQGKGSALPLSVPQLQALHRGGTVTRGGWTEYRYEDKPASIFLGSTGYFRGTVFIYPSKNIAVVIASNADDPERSTSENPVAIAHNELLKAVLDAQKP